ncbi:MAG: hypothetical protein OEU26_23850 [Candidatus Tectomicrobia bacterium]|nr:hypothetical protein [Candidatus Tectomicrobia bacterium]
MAIEPTPRRRKRRVTHHASQVPASGVLVAAMLLASAFCLIALPSCTQAQPAAHPKMQPYAMIPEAEKINVQLLRLEHRVRTQGEPLGSTAIAMGISTFEDRIGLEVYVSPLDAKIVRKFQLPGVNVRHVSMQYQRVLLVIDDLALLYDLARIPEVRVISPEYGATTNPGVMGGSNRAQQGGAFDGR